MSGKKGLGRGLGALIDDFNEQESQQPRDLNLPIYKIEPNPLQPRSYFDEAELQELADSIAQHGVIQPLTVRKMPNDFYQIIAGERRWRAARQAGLAEIPAVIVEADDRKAMELAMIENLQRQDLNPIEEARGYQRLMEEYGHTQEAVADCVGKSRSAVANALRLLTLQDEVQELVVSGALSAGHARAVLSIRSEKLQKQAAQRIVALQLSVRQAERMCKTMDKEPEPPKEKPLAVNYIEECERQLSKRIGRGVKIQPGKRKGRCILEFYGAEDLERLMAALQTLNLQEERKE